MLEIEVIDSAEQYRITAVGIVSFPRMVGMRSTSYNKTTHTGEPDKKSPNFKGHYNDPPQNKKSKQQIFN